ncbi:MAG TPA: energy transducer TonB [Bacteroidota bacterium]
MRREEGLAPKIAANNQIRLGTTPDKLYELSLSLALVLVIVGFKFFPFHEGNKKIVIASRENVTVEDIVQTRQENRPPPPPRPSIPIEAPAAEALEDVDITSSELNIAQEVAPPPPKPNEDDDENYFVVVEDYPQLIGGYDGLMKRVVYPTIALRAGIQGRIFLLAYVNEQGGVDRVDIVKGLEGGLSEAAVEAVKQSSFTPGKQRGRPVKVKVSLVVHFKIKGSI